MNRERPVNLNIATIKFPMTAITSILHRLTGILLFLFVPFVLWVASFSLSSEQNFNVLKAVMAMFWLRFVLWIFISALFYHIVAGVRHLLMDLHLGESRKGGMYGAWFVFLFSVIVIVLLGIYLLIGFNHVW